jgi:hypothetical protein
MAIPRWFRQHNKRMRAQALRQMREDGRPPGIEPNPRN